MLASLPDCDFADPLPSHPEAAVIDILLGSDYFWDIIGEGRQTLPSGLTMVQTKLGFVLSGRYQDRDADSRQHALHVCYVSTMTQQSTLTALDSLCTSFTPLQTPDIADFWQLEHIGIKDPPAVNDNDQAMSAFSSSVSLQEGRYEVAWPWKDSSPTIQDNFPLAYGRMKSLARRL